MNTNIEATAEAIAACVEAIHHYSSSDEAINQVETDYGIRFTKNERFYIKHSARQSWEQIQRDAGVTSLTSDDRRKAFRDLA